MKCVKCHADNPPYSAFCIECGAKLAVQCPICGTPLDARFKFCNKCGHDLSKLLATPEPSDLTPPTLATPSTVTPATSPQGARRQATVLFSDLSGYTAMNERLDPEEVEEIMRRIKGEAVKIVEG